MDVGLIGLPQSGKTTIFNLLTGSAAQVNAYQGTKAESRRALAPVPDSRLEWLKDLYHPRKVTPVQIAVVDVPGLSRQENAGPNRFLHDVRLVDALVLVVRGFVSGVGEPPRPLADLEDMELELGLSDLDLLEKREERLLSGKKLTKESQTELELVRRLAGAMNDGARLSQVPLTDDERRLLQGYQFLTLKPMIWVINLDDRAFQAGTYPDRGKIEELAAAKGIPVVEMAGAIEQEIAQLDAADRAAFMEDLGIETSGTARMARAIYERLGVIAFLTAGEDEVRAWTIDRGVRAKEAAGKIHSDIERGFIRAEVVAFDALKAAGTMAKARELGLVRLEGKEYLVNDGDIINFRFNV